MPPFRRLARIELNVVLEALVKEGIDANYTELVKEANIGCLTGVSCSLTDFA